MQLKKIKTRNSNNKQQAQYNLHNKIKIERTTNKIPICVFTYIN